MAQTLPHTATVGSSAVLKIAYYGSALAFCCVTMAANLNFGLTLGTTLEEKLIYATASVAADIVKSTWMMVVIQLWQARRYGRACIASALWMGCLLWSLASATGFALATRDRTAAVHAAALQSAEGWTAIVRRAGEQLDGVHPHRPAPLIQAELASELVPAPIWKRTAQCAEVTLPESREACARVLALRQELAAAQAATALEERIAEARRQLKTIAGGDDQR